LENKPPAYQREESKRAFRSGEFVNQYKKRPMRKATSIIFMILMMAVACRSTRTVPQSTPVTDVQEVVSEQVVEEVVASGEAAPQPVVDWYRPDTWLIGYFQPDLLLRPPHNAWYTKGYDDYKPEMETIFKIQDSNIDGVSILIVLGTWCGDSRREVPRFLKMLDQCSLTRIKVTYLGVDLSKYSPVGDYEKLKILKVPTFIVYRNNIEAGRIIEYPVTSLERDFLEILSKEIKKN
jgi:hypothetical protein